MASEIYLNLGRADEAIVFATEAYELDRAAGRGTAVNEVLPDGTVGSPAEAVKETVLIVEDNKDVAYYIGMQLQDRYTLHYASDGAEGLAKAGELMPDLIVTDLMMPNMDGLQLCGNVRSSEILNHIPKVVITAKATGQDKIIGIDAGADAYIYKPFDAEELRVTVAHLLESRRVLREKYSKAMQECRADEVHLPSLQQMFMDKLTDTVYRLMEQQKIDTGIENCSEYGRHAPPVQEDAP